ncbi:MULTISPECIES: FUN14 domain-containing protein [Thermoprotei]|uniref:FUN14 domain-containing protein n=1 Tax=Thermoprotei TaxID=183924 RepID=UPI003161A9B0
MSLVQGIGSFILGYLVAKGVKVLLTIIGFFLAILMILQLAGYISVNWDKIQTDLTNTVNTLMSGQVSIDTLEDYVPSIMGFILGILLGSGVVGGLFRRRQAIPY